MSIVQKIASKKPAIIFIASLLIIFALFIINKDIFHYSNVILIGRNFDHQIDSKQRYILTETIPLKQGTYTFLIQGRNQGQNNQWVLWKDEAVVQSGEFPIESDHFEIRYDVTPGVENIRFGVYYDQSPDEFQVDEITITSEFVFYKDSLLRHLTLSLLVCCLFAGFLFRLFYPGKYRRLLGNFARPENERLLLFFILLTILVSFPFFQKDYIKGDDSTFHIGRIEGIKASLEAGFFPVRIYLFTLNDYGFGAGFFYPDQFLYFPALLRLLGFDFIVTYKIFIIVLHFFSIVSIYYAAAKIGKNRFSGQVAAILYTFSAYRLIDVYYRGAVGEVLVFIWIPLIILGLVSVFSGKPEKWPFIAIGLTGLVFSHIISTLLCGIFILVFLLLKLPRLIREKALRIALLKAGAVTLLLTTFFWAPMLEQYFSVNLTFNNSAADMSQPPIPLRSIFALDTVWEPPVQPYVGYPTVLAFLLCFFPGILRKKESRIGRLLLLVGYIGIILSTDLFPWELFHFILQNIQFTWRFLILSIPFLTLGAAVLLPGIIQPKQQRWVLLLLMISCFAFSWPILSNTAYERRIESRGYKLERNRISDGKYIHVNADKEFIDKNQNTVLSSDPSFINLAHERNKLTFSFDFEVQEDRVEFEIPLLFYKGYQAELTDAAGNTIPLEVYPGLHGFTTVTVNGVQRGHISVAYKGTPIQKTSDWVTFLTVLFFIGAGVKKKYWSRKNQALS